MIEAGLGRVSRASSVQTSARNFTRDEGRPLEVGSQVRASNHCKLLLLRDAMRPKEAASSSFDCLNSDQKERDTMTQFLAATSSERTLHAALELSKNSWLLAIQFPNRDKASLYPIKGGDADGLMARLDAARDRLAKVSGQKPKVTLCYEAMVVSVAEKAGRDPARYDPERRA